uniref:Uncharacterized protein n=1 Tax=viral metagenome TaxID=1070528 RepID=A0A6C0C648_9ZZZZ
MNINMENQPDGLNNTPIVPSEIPQNELIYFKEKVKHWLAIDKQVTDLENQIKDIKKVKKELMPQITKFMVEHNITDLNTENGKLKCSERKTKSTLNKNYIRIELEKVLGEQSDKIDSCMDNILNNRSVKITHILRKVKS